jgi:pterocarpan reductase
VDQNHGVNEGKNMFETKVKFRRDIEAAGIPHTYVVANFLTQHFLPSMSQLMHITSTLDTVIILGDGNTKCM